MRNMLVASLLALALGAPVVASAHCQIPCGIYDDHARVHAMLEDVTTIGKAVDQIKELSAKKDALSLNQATRWIVVKEEHASHIITVISEYFLTQKIKPADKKNTKAWTEYVQQLTDHHDVMRLAMKTKQTVDPAAVQELQAAVKKLETWWPAKK